MRDGMFGPELPPVFECLDCHHQDWEGNTHESRAWCDPCACDVVPTEDGLCPDCGEDQLCSACPKCAGEFIECDPDWEGVGRFPRNGDDRESDSCEDDAAEYQAERETVDA